MEWEAHGSRALRADLFYGGLDPAQELIGTSEVFVIVYANLLQELLSLQNEGTGSGSACCRGSFESGGAIRGRIVGFLVFQLPSFCGIWIHVDRS